MSRSIARAGRAVLFLAALAMAGCSTVGSAVNDVTSVIPGAGPRGPQNGTPGYVKGFLGGVVADEPSAALVGRDVLSAGGTAADAAVAVGFALAVTLPSRAGLGGGGGCLAYDPRRDGPGKGEPQAVLFLPRAPAHVTGVADRPAAVPMLARGLYLLHARYGNRVFESLLAPAEAMARDGVTVSRSLAHDLSIVAGPLSADPGAHAVFFPNGTPAREGQKFIQPALAATLDEMRRNGIGDLYQGRLAQIFANAAETAGGGLTIADLRTALARIAPTLDVRDGAQRIAFLPPPADGGLAAAAAFDVLRTSPQALDAARARGIAVAARWRQGGVAARALLAAAGTLPAASLPALPASTTFAVLDHQGNAVVCALTMNNLFGTGRVAAGTGILLAASPSSFPPPLLTAAIAYAPRQRAFRAAVGASGQDGAPLAGAVALRNALAGKAPMPALVPAPGRANVIACPDLLPGDPQSCGWAADPRGSGFAMGRVGTALPPGSTPMPSTLPFDYAPAPGIPDFR